VELLAPRPTRRNPEGPTIFVRVVSLSSLVPIWKRQKLVFLPLHDLDAKDIAQGSRRGHECLELGRHKWCYPRFHSTHPPARCAPSGPGTSPLSTQTVFIHTLFHKTAKPKKFRQCIINLSPITNTLTN
jgi:hypothetical protein